MIRFSLFTLALLGAALVLRAETPRLDGNGALELDGWRVVLSAFDSNWRTLQPGVAPEMFKLIEHREEPGGFGSLRYQLRLPAAAPGTLYLSLEAADGGNARVRGEAEFEQPSLIRFLCLQGALSISQYSGTMFEADGKLIRFPEAYTGEEIISRPVKRFRLATRNGEILLEGDFFLRLQDGRKWNGSTFGLRIAFLPHSGEVRQTRMAFSIRHGKAGEFGPELGSIVRPPLVSAPGAEWKAFEYHRNVIPGSALDFSAELDAPAGKYGPVIAGADGRFVFRERPELPVRFYGANFIGDSQLPDRKQAEELADRMAAFGFNAVRIHHHDNEIYDRSGKEPSRIDPERMDRLEYFLACLKKRGIYYTTDIYVSRRQIPASELGKVGAVATPQEYKALVYIDDTVFENWKEWAAAFLGRVNPHTGLALKDDPALITLSLVNEGNPASFWNSTPRSTGLYQRGFEAWKAENPGGDFDRYLSHLAVKRFREMKAFLNGLGSRTLLTDQNFQNEIALAADRAHYDFVDNHAYWDHPRFAEKRWELPVLPNQLNPLGAVAGVPGAMMPTRLFGKAFTVTEFDYANPNRYRAVGPALISAYGAFQGWDGLFPFAYAHSLASVVNPARTSGFFDISTDPVKAFSQRIGARLFLSGGITPGEQGFAAVATEPFRRGGASAYPDSFCDLGFLARIGTVTELPAPGGVTVLVDIGNGSPAPGGKIAVFRASENLIAELIRAGALPKDCFDAAQGRFSTPQLELNRKRRTLRITAPGGEVLAMAEGKLQGKHLDVENSGPFSVFALLPVDSVRIGDARRLTLMHLTNTQASGMTFGNDRLDRLESWGNTPFLARHGKAKITLRRLPGDWAVHALDTAGRRIGELPATASPDGSPAFEIDNFRWPEAVFAYELVRRGK